MRKHDAIFAIAIGLTTLRFSIAADKMRLGDFADDKEKAAPVATPRPTETPKRKPASAAPSSERANRIRYVPVPHSKKSPATRRTKPAPVSSVAPVSSPAESAADRAQALYLQALQASQHGRYDKALDLCRESLALDPSNLQAQRMSERLESRTGHR